MAILTKIKVPKMDCPSEEQLIRNALARTDGIVNLKFDLSSRTVDVLHNGSPANILSALGPLNLGATVLESKNSENVPHFATVQPQNSEAKVLKLLLAINAVMFFIEITSGFFAQSTGLIADSLDMFADAAVYGVSLYAVGRQLTAQKFAAKLSGYLQLLLAAGGLFEVLRRSYVGSEPDMMSMIGIGGLALLANISCMALLMKHREGEVHMKASWIFSTNDVIANTGVIAAGVLVKITGSPYPDLIVGFIIATIVARGAFRILSLSK